ncbi:MAG: serine hydroxymethyltransferase [Acidimicrobiia bacterium]|nr:serine hydroxymethyltransferase [Acidimicrobiia bacterium]MDH4307064.1 serine hydroxymethyltransferase [Acidimicrobiia bacterium]MDH5292762.1 serine hydroxymethyltransferase [Acidimicrobiia bacterium]
MDPIESVDPAIAGLIRKDLERQNTHIHLIASENFASPAVMAASGSVFTNKYAEGYPGRRYYEGCLVVDEMEALAIERAKELFGAGHANVQPHSGAQANMGVYLALLDPGDTVLGMRLDQGGHLTHGSPVNFSGQQYNFVAYGLDPDTERIDMENVRALALEHRPKIVLAGYSAYPRHLDYAAFRAIADEIGAVFMVDAAHFIGLVAGKAFPNPVESADIVTATTHKALRGPRGGMILSTEEYAKVVDKAVFPGGQGGPIESQIAAKAVCFKENATPEFQAYARQILANAAAMADQLQSDGVRLVTGGTDNHLMLVDLRSIDADLTGREAAKLLDSIGITLNFNAIPNDPRPPMHTSGLRIGTPAMTTQGMKEAEATQTAALIARALKERGDSAAVAEVEAQVRELARSFPPYPADWSGHV